MSKVKANIIANFAGKGWTALMSLAFVPLYIKFLGIEAYGLIGFFVTLQALFGLLDMGLSATLNRELARTSGLAGQENRMRDLVRTLEIIYWLIAIIICVSVILLAPIIAQYWIKAENLSVETVQQSVILLGIAIAFQWPLSFYSGGLQGLQKQVLYNILYSGLATLRGVGAVLVLWLVSSTIEAYFQWQVLVSLLSTATIAFALWKSLPECDRASRFDWKILHSIWRFAAGMTAITAVTVILTQLDKVLLSTLLPLESYGYYMLASVVAGALYYLIGPIRTALFPKFSQLVAQDDVENLAHLYHQTCQLMSVVILPMAMILVMFSYEIMVLWTVDITIAENTHWLISLLVIGTTINGLMNLPYGLQIAYGWTRLSIYTNTVAAVLLAPMLFIMVHYYNAIGAAVVWVVLNTGYIIIGVQLMHRRLLKEEKWRWYIEDVFRPLMAALLVAVTGRLILPAEGGPFIMAIYLTAVLLLAYLLAILVTPMVRARFLIVISRAKAIYN